MMHVARAAVKIGVLMVALSAWWGCSGTRTTVTMEPVHDARPSGVAPVQQQSAGDRQGPSKTGPGNSSQADRSKPAGSALRGGQVSFFIHYVRWRSETFYSIALWYTGSGTNWERLAAVNPTIAPRRIRIGDAIRIPHELLKTRQPMPLSFLSSISGRKNNPPPKPSRPSASKPEDVQLYGPIDQETPSMAPEESGLPVPLETLD